MGEKKTKQRMTKEAHEMMIGLHKAGGVSDQELKSFEEEYFLGKEELRPIRLGKKEADRFSDLIKNPPEPGKNLKKLFEKHQGSGRN